MNNKEIDINLEEKLKLLKNSYIFSTLTDKELEVIINYSNIYYFHQNSNIYKEITGRLFIVKNGNIIIERETENKKIALAHYINNDTFGELDLFLKKDENLVAIAETDSEILVFPDKEIDFEQVISQYPALFAKVLHNYMILIAKRIRSNNKLISEKTPWIEELKKQLYQDKLTGAYNNTYLDEEFPHIINELGDVITFLYIKPDNFKDINDNFGHEAGDNALKYLLEMIRTNLKNFIVVRYRGNESCVILPKVLKEESYKIAEKVKEKIKSTNIKKITNNKDFFITVSIGITSYPDETKNVKDLIKIAYDKMMIGRNNGGDKIVI